MDFQKMTFINLGASDGKTFFFRLGT